MRLTLRAIVAVSRTLRVGLLVLVLCPCVEASAGGEIGPADKPLPVAAQSASSPRAAVSFGLLTFIFVVQTLLVIGLVTLAVKRQRLQRSLDRRLRFERLLSDITLTFARVGADRIDLAVETALVQAAAAMSVDRVWLWNADEAADAGWSSLRLECGEPAMFARVDELPPSVQAQVVQALDAFSAAATPLQVGGAVLGALFWGSFRNVGSWSLEQLDQLRMISDAFAGVRQRMQTDRAREESDRLKGAILSSLPARIAVLDSAGVIISVNDAWTQFELGDELQAEGELSPGANYLDACRTSRRGHPGTAETLAGIEAACRGEQQAGEYEYCCEASGQTWWFVMTATLLRRPQGGVVVTHRDITARKRNEIALRESEDRFRTLADGLPLVIWMSELDQKCSYFNKQWLLFTGRSLEDELAGDWISNVHPDDRAVCIDRYSRASEAREPFTMEYRVRRFDGEYRWLLSSGSPRYGSDGTFHGFVGGCLDITEHKEDEKRLVELSRRLIVAQEEERRRIARELHDHLSQQLALLAIELQQLDMHPPEVLSATLHDLWRRTTEIASDVHGISHRLHPSKLEALGLVITMRGHCRDVSRHAVRVHFTDREVPADLPPDLALCLFRILEEAVSNAVRHSASIEAFVTLESVEHEVVLRVVDTGCGFDPAAKRHAAGLGLVSMRERVRAVGGTLTVVSSPGQGTTIEARVRHVEAVEAITKSANAPFTPQPDVVAVLPAVRAVG